MGKKNKSKSNLATPENEAKRVIINAKSYNLPIYSATVNLGDDVANLTKCLELINTAVKDTNQSILLVSANDKFVVSGAISNSEKVSAKDWVMSGINSVNQKEVISDTNSEDSTKQFTKKVEVGDEAFGIKEKETALANSFNYIKNTGIMPDDDDESSELEFNLNDI